MKTTGAEVTPSLGALLHGSVDYAGLFPPAALALEPALDNHVAYLRSEEAWMLGCFVLPVARLMEAKLLLTGRFDEECSLQVSALGSKAATTDEFLDNLRAARRGLAEFQKGHTGNVVIEQLEAPLPSDTVPGTALAALLRKAASLLGDPPLSAFWEVPFSDDLPAWLRGVATHNAGVPRPFGVKLRTGGLEAAAFPACEQLAAALTAAWEAGIALKFTAGLHHPFRRFDAGVNTQMHGFVNVFVAGALLGRRGFNAAHLPAVLEDEDPMSFRFDADGFRWRDHLVTTDALATARSFVTSFGSCSFDEPRDDLRAAGLLP